MHIPQGMGYALLAELPPIFGIYLAFFPVFLYVLLGTSRHSSMGSFAIVSIMVGRVVSTYADPKYLEKIGNSTDTDFDEDIKRSYSPLQVISILCFIVGVIHVRIESLWNSIEICQTHL